MIKLDAKKFLVAAERIGDAQNDFSCCAIAGVPDVIAPPSDGAELDAYTAMFSPPGSEGSAFWAAGWDVDGADPFYGCPHNTDEGRACRILALCFAAAMVKAGDLPLATE